MAISFVDSATGTNTIASVPTHQVGDLLLIFAAREDPNTIPTVPGGEGWTTVDSGGTSNVSYVCCWKLADSTSETTGTFTNALFTHLHIYRGCKQAGPIGGSHEVLYNDSIVYYGTVTFTVTDGTSWCAAFAAHGSGDTNLQTAPSGMTNRTNQTGGGFEVAGHDTNGGASGYTGNVSVGGTQADYVTISVELLAEPAASSSISNRLSAVRLSRKLATKLSKR